MFRCQSDERESLHSELVMPMDQEAPPKATNGVRHNPCPTGSRRLWCFSGSGGLEQPRDEESNWRPKSGEGGDVVTSQPRKPLKTITTVTGGARESSGPKGPILCYSPKKTGRGQIDLFPRQILRAFRLSSKLNLKIYILGEQKLVLHRARLRGRDGSLNRPRWRSRVR